MQSNHLICTACSIYDVQRRQGPVVPFAYAAEHRQSCRRLFQFKREVDMKPAGCGSQPLQRNYMHSVLDSRFFPCFVDYIYVGT
jgi:hypothetical protein